jgi:hypothetical protein
MTWSNADGGMSTVRRVVEDNTWAGPGHELQPAQWV